MPTKRIVCLANSRKLHGRCIAGQELSGVEHPNAWIRPVSDRQHQEVSEYERQYSDGRDPKLLDIIDIPLLQHLPTEHQHENWLLDPDYYWQKVGEYSWDDLHRLSDSRGPLWRNGSHSSNGMNDRIALAHLTDETTSLKLINVTAIGLRVFAPGRAFGNSKRRVQGHFRFSGAEYRLWVTDPVIERHYLALDDGQYDCQQSYLTVSLGEAYDGYCYKLIAAVMERPR